MHLPESPLIGERVIVRPATTTDVDLLAAWHAQPDIARQWGYRTFSREEIAARLRRPYVDPYVIEEGGLPVGYIQAWFDDDPSRAGLDMFLIADARGRGLGPDAARTQMRWLFSRPSLRRLTVDPYVSNAAALRAWSKAGFRVASAHPPDDENDEPWVLMVADPGAVRVGLT